MHFELRSPSVLENVAPSEHCNPTSGARPPQELKVDRDGNQRTAYSLRHTYVCFRLLEGADIYQVAKNCRTSVEMIEKFYAAHLKNTLDASAINVRKSRGNGRWQNFRFAQDGGRSYR